MLDSVSQLLVRLVLHLRFGKCQIYFSGNVNMCLHGILANFLKWNCFVRTLENETTMLGVPLGLG